MSHLEPQAVKEKVQSLMPGIVEDLNRLVGHASVAFPGWPSEPVEAMAEDVVGLFREAGVGDVRLLDLGAGYPAVYGTIPGPPGAPHVLLYGHYDVQPAPVEAGWRTDPFVATVGEDGRIYGRGAADDKSGIVAHLGTLRAFDGRPPVGVTVLIEGEEETISHLEEYVDAHPELFQADAFVVCDMGNLRVGEPVLTTALRGAVSCTVKITTLDNPVHSGLFGGAAPDALLALIRLLSTLHTPEGDVAVEGLHSYEWPGADFPEDDFRACAGVQPGVDLPGTGTIASRLWSKPSVTAIGLTAATVEASSNVLIPTASAKLSMRVVPGCDADKELGLLMDHLRNHAPWNVKVEVEPVDVGWPFAVDMSGPAVAKAAEAMSEAFGRPSSQIGSGGSIPLVAALKKASPGASVILWGPEDIRKAAIHAPNESVDPDEIRDVVCAQTLFLAKLAEG